MMDSPMLSSSCRCCASEGAYKDVKSSYHWMGEEEIYADMLKDCFDISLGSASDGQEEGGICEICITQLRNAANFKKQVLHTEEQFKNKLQTGFFKHEIVKVEVSGEDGNDSDDNNASAEEGYSGPEFEVPIKAESPEEPKPKKRAAKKGPTTRAKKAKTDAEDPETSTKREHQPETVFNKRETRLTRRVKNENRNPGKMKVIMITKPRVAWVKKKPKIDEKTKKKKTIKIPAEKDKESKSTKWGPADKHHTNIREIMECSNATPIRCYGGIGYACCFCDAQYPEPVDLKKHTSTTHNDVTEANFFKTRRIDQYIVRLDITALVCKLCNDDIDTLDQLIDHLIITHKKNMYTDINNQIVPFKFNTDTLSCFICTNVFNKFKTLLWHMNSHYRNYVCSVCDAGFVNNGILSVHARTHRTGTFVCDYCPKMFNTHVKKKAHESRIHMRSNLSHKCGYCSEKFRDYRVKEAHMTQVHNVRAIVYKCQACDKTFKNRTVLYIHTKRHHLLQRPHKCHFCEMDFFTSYDLKKHLVKHTGSRDFQCEVCLKCFGRMTTLKTHMRTHANKRY